MISKACGNRGIASTFRLKVVILKTHCCSLSSSEMNSIAYFLRLFSHQAGIKMTKTEFLTA